MPRRASFLALALAACGEESACPRPHDRGPDRVADPLHQVVPLPGPDGVDLLVIGTDAIRVHRLDGQRVERAPRRVFADLGSTANVRHAEPTGDGRWRLVTTDEVLLLGPASHEVARAPIEVDDVRWPVAEVFSAARAGDAVFVTWVGGAPSPSAVGMGRVDDDGHVTVVGPLISDLSADPWATVAWDEAAGVVWVDIDPVTTAVVAPDGELLGTFPRSGPVLGDWTPLGDGRFLGYHYHDVHTFLPLERPGPHASLEPPADGNGGIALVDGDVVFAFVSGEGAAVWSEPLGPDAPTGAPDSTPLSFDTCGWVAAAP